MSERAPTVSREAERYQTERLAMNSQRRNRRRLREAADKRGVRLRLCARDRLRSSQGLQAARVFSLVMRRTADGDAETSSAFGLGRFSEMS